ncbi:hypothetical protein RKE29_10930 [Streptomyces sp. B1866]|uniref:hypothetical protein n=1 Tax=Streptomyces sp. B1866 TaxID=3075431 RepID=UPI002890B770|nr:hypothetical protein [Streptomyces sp. B1866]MDT3397153.1 hypothetical protein [Streptomyces sp. B1866]
MSGRGDLEVGKESVDLITRGLRSAVGELKGIGGTTDALQGAGLSELAMTKMEAGGGGLADAFEGFCDQWEWGVRTLVQDASELADQLGIAAGTHWEEDRYLAGTLKVAVNAVSPTGNPHASEEEVADQSWDDVLTPDAPDYSGRSFEQAGHDAAQTWKDAAGGR